MSGSGTAREKRIQPPVFLLGGLLLMIALHLTVPLRTLIVAPWNLLGLLLIAVGCALNVVADAAFKRHRTAVRSGQRSAVLVTDGVFRFSRNPMYLGMVVILAGVALLLGSLSPWLPVVLLALGLERVFIRHEELMLEETFGPQFREYRRRVRRWL